MESSGRKSQDSLIQELFSDPWKFDFEQIIKIIEYVRTDKVSIVDSYLKHEEAISLSSTNFLHMVSEPVHDLFWQIHPHKVMMGKKKNLIGRPSLENILQNIDPNQKDYLNQLPYLYVNFLGLGGAQGPLPHPYTELILSRNFFNDSSLASFLDIFNHRILTLYYKIRYFSFPSISNLKLEKSNYGSILSMYCGAAVTNMIEQNKEFPNDSFLIYSHYLSQNSRSLKGLEIIISDFFSVDCKIENFQGCWKNIPEITRIGHKLGRENILGSEFFLGHKYFDFNYGFLISIKNIKLISKFFVGGVNYEGLKFIVNLYTEKQYKAQLELEVMKNQIQICKLGVNFSLGIDSWIFTTEDSLQDEYKVTYSL